MGIYFSAGVQAGTRLLVFDDQIDITLETGSQRPLYFQRVVDVNIFVHDENMLARAMALKGGLDGFSAVVVVLLIDLYDCVQPGTPARVDIDIQAVRHLADLLENRWLAWHAH
ncbi:MAG: hypothetical protein H6Q37_1885 [Chloroflexi bacterium]|nr:hypothetical protein [Chloroflexota bacterium]